MRVFAKVLTWVFLPLFMPMYALLIALYIPTHQQFYFDTNYLYLLYPESKLAFVYIYSIFCVGFPGISYIILILSKQLSTVEMEDRRERTLPMIIMFVSCLMLYMILLKSEMPLPKAVYALPLAGVILTGVFTVMNQWKKISIHAAGAGILTGFVLAYAIEHGAFQPRMLIWTIVISGLVMTARRYLGRHTLFELVLGWLTGTLITFAVSYFYW